MSNGKITERVTKELLGEGHPPEHIALARKVVESKAVYWDLLRELEQLTPGGEWPDKVNDAVLESVEMLAVGAPSDDDLRELLDLAKGKDSA